MVSLDKYTHYEQDNDYHYYRFKNRDVLPYHNENKDVNTILERYRKKIIQTLFIKWNWLYFSIDGIKYYEKISTSLEEEEYIEKIIKDLNAVKGVKDVCYEWGTLD